MSPANREPEAVNGAPVKHQAVRAAVLLASAVAVASLAACGTAKPGAAAIVGDERISENLLAEQVAEVLSAQGQPADAPADALTATTLDRLVTSSLVEQFAEENGVVVTQGEVDALLRTYAAQAGGADAVDAIFLEQNVAPSQIVPILRLNILAEKIGTALVPGGDPQAQGQALVEVLAAYSAQVGTDISPRYGSWDPAGLGIGPVPDDLSVPRS